MEILSGKMKMAALVERDFHLTGLILRVGITESFGERTVEELCQRNGIDTDTFLRLCEIFSDPQRRLPDTVLQRLHINDVMHYLVRSHDYYLNSALGSLQSMLQELTAPCTEGQKRIFRHFYADYREELRAHFEYEERSLIPYAQALLEGRRPVALSIDALKDNHPHIQEAISDLKSLVLKSLPPECDPGLRIEALHFIYLLQLDLERHTRIEDEMFVPMIRLLENPLSGQACGLPGGDSEAAGGEEREELTSREKEILAGVARGMLNKEIADAYGISVNTVITHRKNITRKTGIRTVPGLTVYAILNDLVDINTIEA